MIDSYLNNLYWKISFPDLNILQQFCRLNWQVTSNNCTFVRLHLVYTSEISANKNSTQKMLNYVNIYTQARLYG